MSDLVYTRVSSDSELNDILQLQKENLPVNLSENEIKNQGFLTVSHNLQILKILDEIEPAIIGKNENGVVAYILAMTENSKEQLPILEEMFCKFKEVRYLNEPISTYNYVVVGQVCVAKQYRGKGVFENCYHLYKNSFKASYDFAVTLISSRNTRSLNAHTKLGFEIVHNYTSPDGEKWNIAILAW